jgi:predicted lysophospholipase L1 biosynthesis ABC-type transport system permease subunit
VHGDHTSLGVGGIVATEQLPDWDRNLHFTGADPAVYGPNVLFVRYRDGADPRAVTARLEQLAPQISDYNGVVVTPVQRSAEIVNADDIGGSARLLGVAVAVAALASLTVALNAAVRRRRRDLALLKTVGFTRRQLGWVVVWQATGTMALGLAIGIPTGWLLGRSLWRLFAVQLDVLAAPAVPAVALLAIALGGVAVANVLAAAPARHARRVPAALVLRSE